MTKGKITRGASNYYRAIWFSAIKNYGDIELKNYNDCILKSKAEPEHPEFASYMTTKRGGRKSPKTIEELQELNIDDLIHFLSIFNDSGKFDEPGLEGLVKVFKELVKANPIDFYLKLNKFLNIDLAYVYEIIEAYRELWDGKEKLPWDEIWQYILDFCYEIINQERFWQSNNAKQRDPFIANRNWIVSGIARLIEAGTKSDENSFRESLLPKAEKILLYLLDKETGVEFQEDCDAVTVSINSPRGTCLESLINLTLRSCRIADKEKNNHSEVWTHFQKYYDFELDRAYSEQPEYEFATLITMYLLNFLYMSREWVFDNLNKIFDQNKLL